MTDIDRTETRKGMNNPDVKLFRGFIGSLDRVDKFRNDFPQETANRVNMAWTNRGRSVSVWYTNHIDRFLGESI